MFLILKMNVFILLRNTINGNAIGAIYYPCLPNIADDYDLGPNDIRMSLSASVFTLMVLFSNCS